MHTYLRAGYSKWASSSKSVQNIYSCNCSESKKYDVVKRQEIYF